MKLAIFDKLGQACAFFIGGLTPPSPKVSDFNLVINSIGILLKLVNNSFDGILKNIPYMSHIKLINIKFNSPECHQKLLGSEMGGQ